MELNHTIIWCHDKVQSAEFLTRILGLRPARPFLHFMLVTLDNNISVDFMEKTGEIALQHYAFLGSETEFDESFARIRAEGLAAVVSILRIPMAICWKYSPNPTAARMICDTGTLCTSLLVLFTKSVDCLV
jgi:catechol 2,3-dioxygenase-like lactoylglutathione lyase family enzyme